MLPLKELFRNVRCPGLIIGLGAADDAAVYQVSEHVAFVFTTDFFTPIVDDPVQFGAIAAANSMSDVYAMGGEILLALNIAGFPESVQEDVVSRVLRGGAEKVYEAGAVVAGGHTIHSTEPFYGLAVVGKAHPARLLTKSGASPGDHLVLTKPLGTGIITTAFKGGTCLDEHLDAAVDAMTALNRNAARAAISADCRSATDVTGFGLIGHALEIARASAVTLEISCGNLPFLPGAARYAEQWLFPAGANRNEQAYAEHSVIDKRISDEKRMLLFTPETSGGLLLSVPERNLEVFVRTCADTGQNYSIIGTVRKGSPKIMVTD